MKLSANGISRLTSVIFIVYYKSTVVVVNLRKIDQGCSK